MTIKYHENYSGTMPTTTNNAAIALAAATENSFTVSGSNNEKYVAIFTYPSNSSVYVAINDTAAAASAGAIDYPSNSLFKPDRLYVKAGDSVSLYANDATECGVRIYRIE
jgi:hypothetical protein